MAANGPEVVIWDASTALRDVAIEMLSHHSGGRSADPEMIRHWHEWIHNAHRVHNALADACEDIVEEGVSAERLEAMKVALTHAMGQITYWRREDRW